MIQVGRAAETGSVGSPLRNASRLTALKNEKKNQKTKNKKTKNKKTKKEERKKVRGIRTCFGNAENGFITVHHGSGADFLMYSARIISTSLQSPSATDASHSFPSRQQIYEEIRGKALKHELNESTLLQHSVIPPIIAISAANKIYLLANRV